MKYQKGDLVRFKEPGQSNLPERIMLITSIIDEVYTIPYGEGYKYRFLDSGREEVCSKANFENITEMIG
jgi:hypothetical protein